MFGGANPMEKSATNSYEAMNYQSAITLAETLAESKTESIAGETAAKPVFIYVSADQQVPMVPVGYIQTKRKAEAELFSRFGDSLRSIVLRPGIMCDEQTAFDFRHAVKGAVDLAGSIGSVTGTSAFVNSIARPVVSTQKVAEVAVKKTEDASFYGIVGLNELVKE
ncbi:hypothetical protein BABINDRAFT_159039 [Babjeviella inositovora NRRL Y-12698]|uniref:Thioester reductase (TE) domain-containing protein n=1 Tax=Babjeviella inositovora NRRL Y-12698 TaxID=984486 RepID=A0A1E3QXQ6_9ASCO|nr:uncharacterized protein BABINDRAFT_159039 [Babjeviella inositovora NRRL Y-12698]ODQ82448.1 hypothetical protein BABINDRAFT_159039 [Babjeviella inositovora NRRL Y-12698]